MKKLVIFSGAGMSAESGISTFRDSNGLWENHRIEDVASPIGWAADPEMVLRFYNLRRKQLSEVNPNKGHLDLVKLEKKFDTTIITQNVDDLHERAGSKNVIHLHGELQKVRSTKDENLVYTLDGWELKIGDTCEKGSQLRPHIVWFGEDVPEFENAVKIASKADIFIVIGTSLQVYPAASLIHFVADNVPKFLIDPKAEVIDNVPNLKIIQEKAGKGVSELVEELLKNN